MVVMEKMEKEGEKRITKIVTTNVVASRRLKSD